MRFAQINPQQSRQKAIDALSGGLNTKEPVEVIGDNQLVSCENMYFEAGELKVRPGFYADPWSVTWRQNNSDVPSAVSRFSTSNGKYNIVCNPSETFVWRNDGVLIFSQGHNNSRTCNAGFFAEKDKDTVLFYAQYTDGHRNIVQIKPEEADPAERYKELTTAQHIPTTFINAKPSPSLFNFAVGGVPYEGYNLLTSAFKSLWTTDGDGLYYAFPFLVKRPFSLTFTDEDGVTRTWTISEPNTSSIDKPIKLNGVNVTVRLSYNGSNNCVWMEKNDGNGNYTHLALPEQGYADNVEVTANRNSWGQADADQVYGCNFATWFGGTASGVGGGTRLFISGNAENPNLVRYSDVNNPFYFPENNFFYVGSESQPVTAFGKQNEYLIIFKPHEMYACEYAWSAVSGEDVAAGIVPDVTADAYFPIRQVHGGIGCDCPGTVQLCGNHLVWANYDDKRLYTLSSFSNYSDRNVRDISWVIEPNIKTSLTKSATAVIWGDLYVLLCSHNNISGEFTNQDPQEIYLFDFTQNGFTYYASYYDEKRASTRIPWYRWTFNLPFEYGSNYVVNRASLMGKNGYLTLSAVYHIASTDFYVQYRLSVGASDSKVAYSGTATTAPVDIDASVVTKFFNFDMPQYLKTVEGAFLKATGHGELAVSWYTGRDEKRQQYRKKLNTDTPTEVRIPYRVGRVRMAALGIKASGDIRIGELIWNFRRLGEVK